MNTDEGAFLLRREMLENWGDEELIILENRGKVWFPEIPLQFKFDMMLVSRNKESGSF